MPDDPDGPSERPSERSHSFPEQRILVLHNSDFGESSDGDPTHEARADVVNQAHDVARALVSEVRGHSGSTPYVRWGNWPLIALALLLIPLAKRRPAAARTA